MSVIAKIGAILLVAALMVSAVKYVLNIAKGEKK